MGVGVLGNLWGTVYNLGGGGNFDSKRIWKNSLTPVSDAFAAIILPLLFTKIPFFAPHVLL